VSEAPELPGADEEVIDELIDALEDMSDDERQQLAQSNFDPQFTFAEYGLLTIDRAQRMLDDLRVQLRWADDLLLAASAGNAIAPVEINVMNHQAQSIGIALERKGSQITIHVHHRNSPGTTNVGSGQIHQEKM
jgi:hypothetical protein